MGSQGDYRFVSPSPRILFFGNPSADYIPRFRKKIVAGLDAILSPGTAAATAADPGSCITADDGKNDQLQIGLTADDVSVDFLHAVDILLVSPFLGPDEIPKLKTMLPKMDSLKWIHSCSAGVDAFCRLIDEHLPTHLRDGEKVPLTNARGVLFPRPWRSTRSVLCCISAKTYESWRPTS